MNLGKEGSHERDVGVTSDIWHLPEIVDNLSGEERELFQRFFAFTVHDARQECTHLGSKPELNSQKIVRTFNRITYEQAKFNWMRASRPQTRGDLSPILVTIEEKRGMDDFCRFEEKTSKDPNFGRIYGKHCITAANLYPFSQHHAVQIFLEHDPLKLPTEEAFLDRLDVTEQWFWKTHQYDKNAIFPSYFQNQLAKGGASLWFHGHAQIELESDFHEGGMQKFIDIAKSYYDLYKQDYFADLFSVHRSVGLGISYGDCLIFPSLTPTKEKQVVLVAWELSEEVRKDIYRLYRCLIEDQGVVAFNFSIGYPPLVESRGANHRIPYIVSMIDRGDPTSYTADVGGSEFSLTMKTSIIATDPYQVQKSLEKVFVF